MLYPIPFSIFSPSCLRDHCISSRRRRWHPTLVLLPGKSHGRRSLVGCRPWGHKEFDTTERPHFHFSLSCIGKGNGNPLQCSCLENPRDRGAWWAAIYGATQTRTGLKQLSSSSSSISSSTHPQALSIAKPTFWIMTASKEQWKKRIVRDLGISMYALLYLK